MRAWLIAHRYTVGVAVATIVCILACALLVWPLVSTNLIHRASAPPQPTLQPVAGSTTATPQDTSNTDGAFTPPVTPDEKDASGVLVACSGGGDLEWSTTAGDLQIVCQCTLTLPADGYVFLSAGGSLSGRTCDYEARFRLGIDGTAGDPATDRWVNIYGDADDGMDGVLAVSALRPLKAGTHTFYLLGRRAGGTGTVLLHDPSLAVIAWPAAER